MTTKSWLLLVAEVLEVVASILRALAKGAEPDEGKLRAVVGKLDISAVTGAGG